MSNIKLNTNGFLILRILFFIVMESLREEEGGFGRVLGKEFMTFSERDFGKGPVIIIKIPVIKVYLHFSKTIYFFF